MQEVADFEGSDSPRPLTLSYHQPMDRQHCQKIRYWKRIDALIALAKAERSGVHQARQIEKRQERRVYRCDICHGHPWHLSSVPA